ncbi:hypothetical protein MGYG_09006 [Nannizzia gypsea CBS 118893]|uniref:Uncharacterized protein n=1 Tax=Arthroderma gypseum (strain ATCC MYA-4604 / CBS 118893) TaxID=535722 RepID=E4UQE6_ARTGP|nr:hypothetical protein MGYG_09006 [Nannizzia gypsea CBS 118893]EFR00016.1 hypothetical protein MGYG_09006 [Nannizzia gypsea CBS 118893]
MNRPGPGQQPIRGMSGFPAQPQSQNRTANTALLSGRLPNSQMGEDGGIPYMGDGTFG